MHPLNFNHQLAICLLLALTLAGGLFPSASAEEARERLKLQISFGHRGLEQRTITPRLTAGSPDLEVSASTKTLEVGAGAIETLAAEVSWPKPELPARETQSIWRYLFDHGEPGQVERLKEDPGRRPASPILTVETAPDGSRGFSIGMEQLIRHKAMWLPEHDAFVTLADSGVKFDAHLASLEGERILERVEGEPEATLAEWREKWPDFGDPTQAHHGNETTWLGTKGHLAGLIARHGSLYKFGVDRWARVRPDHASPHKFRFDPIWRGAARWKGQRIMDGLPVLETRIETDDVQVRIEQFAAALDDAPPKKRGEIAGAVFSEFRMKGDGLFKMSFRLAAEDKGRRLEMRQREGRWRVVDRETGDVWLMIETGAHFTVLPRDDALVSENSSVVFDCSGKLKADEESAIVFKLPSPVAPSNLSSKLASMDFDRARESTARYWENWLDRGARFEVPEKAINDLFRANLWHALFLPRHRKDEKGMNRIDLPYSNFAYGQYNADWPINQAVYVDNMIYGLRGYDSVAEEEFAAIYQTQQKEDGRVGGYAEWGVYTPSMLYSIGRNFLLSQNRESFERLLPRSLRALDWCLREIAGDGMNASTPGLIVAPLNDLTHDKRAWAFPNAYFVAGLHLFSRALAAYGHPRAGEVQEAADQMRANVSLAFARASVKSPVVRLADGTWNNYAPSDALTPRRLLEEWYPTDVDCGPLHLARLAAIDPRGWLAAAMLHDHEDNLFFKQWGMANEPVYNPQASVYLYRDMPEAAIRAFYSMTACAFSHHQLTPLEHRWAWGQYYMPPSTDGAWFELYRNLILNELAGDKTLFVGQAIPRAWLEDGKQVVVSNAPTYFGPVNLEIESSVQTENITANIEFAGERRPEQLIVRLRHPEKKRLRSLTVNGVEWNAVDASKEQATIGQPLERRYIIVARY